MRCNTKQSIYYSARSLYMFRVSTTPIISNRRNCNYCLRYWSFFVQLPPSNVAKLAWPRWREAASEYRSLQLQFCVFLMMDVVDAQNM